MAEPVILGSPSMGLLRRQGREIPDSFSSRIRKGLTYGLQAKRGSRDVPRFP